MRRANRAVILLTGILAMAGPLFAITDPTPEEMEQNRQRLEKWRANPKEYARLLGVYREMLVLPPDARERLRRLDRDLHQETPSTQARLFDVLDRYADWLERLPPQERQQIANASDRSQRLQVIRRIRDREWEERLPATIRKQLGRAAIAEKARQELLDQLRRRQKQRLDEWRIEMRRPFTLAQLKQLYPETHRFVEEYLRPRLSVDEQKRIDAAAEKSAVFPKTLVELAEKYPPALQGPRGPKHFQELPKAVQDLLRSFMAKLKDPPPNTPALHGLKRFLENNAEGKWPTYGTAIARAARLNKSPLPYELWPSRLADLSREMKAFYNNQLWPVLSADEKGYLQGGKAWPEFPRRIQELARKHDLHPPWLMLPGRRSLWASYLLPDVPRHTLRQFAAIELSEKDRDQMGLTRSDPQRWERLKAEYFKRKPQELQKLKEAEKKPAKKKGK